jgi:hypothetical protein
VSQSRVIFTATRASFVDCSAARFSDKCDCGAHDRDPGYAEDLQYAVTKNDVFWFAWLSNKYAHTPTDQVATAIQRVYARFEQSPIRDFVPLLVERRAGSELATLKEPVAASL